MKQYVILKINYIYLHTNIKSNIAQEPGMLGPLNQGKLEVAKQEMARVTINILGINELMDWNG